MGLTFKKKSTSTGKPAKAVPSGQGEKKLGKSLLFKHGKAAKAALEEEEAKAAARKEQQDKTRRFWMKPGTKVEITFVDGDLDEDGLLTNIAYKEHQVEMNGHFRNWFMCVGEIEPCPICMSDVKGKYPQYVSAFTIIEHTEFESKGKIYKDQKRMLVAKGAALQQLQDNATVHGGLKGCRFQVGRSTKDQSVSIGDSWVFLKKEPMGKVAKAMPGVDLTPLDYDKEIVYYSADELRVLGFGGIGTGVGNEPPPFEGDDDAGDDEGYSKHL